MSEDTNLSQEPSDQDYLPPEPGDCEDETLGLSDEEAGFPPADPPEDDKDLGIAELDEDDGDDIEEEDDDDV